MEMLPEAESGNKFQSCGREVGGEAAPNKGSSRDLYGADLASYKVILRRMFPRMDELTKAHNDGKRLRPSWASSRIVQGGGREVISPGSRPPTRRLTVGDGSPPSKSQSTGTLQQRPSTVEVLMAAHNGPMNACFQASTDFQSIGGKVSSLNMSPRTARKYRIHKHRLSCDGALDEHQRRDSRGGSLVGADSLAILAAKENQEDADPWLCGFRVDDIVSTAEGQDADGPWGLMGVGRVVEPSEKKGLLKIYFPKIGEAFHIRAFNLLNITDPSRSGNYDGQRRTMTSSTRIARGKVDYDIINERKETLAANKERKRRNDGQWQTFLTDWSF